MNTAYHPLRATHTLRAARPFFVDSNRLNGTVRSEEPEHEWSPVAVIAQAENGYLLELDIPGVTADSIDVSLDKAVLSVSGERPATHSEGAIIRSERLTGKFIRRFSLAEEVDTDSIQAHINNGVLSVELKRKEKIQAKKITVTTTVPASEG